MALLSAKKMADTLGHTSNVAWYVERMERIKKAYNQVYWKNGFYSSKESNLKDDRANALAILSGLAEERKFDPIIENVLISNKYASPNFEWMVEADMCEADRY